MRSKHMKNLVLATQNKGKLEEFSELLAPLSWQVSSLGDFSDESPDETGTTFVENAIIKARFACQCAGLPAIADDSGLVVEALNGAPGVISARYAGEGKSANEHNAKLLEAMQGIPVEQRQAHFFCCLVFLRHKDDPEPIICTAKWHGRILEAPRGNKGFGYNPVFLDESTGLSAAEMSSEQKNEISHRGQALRMLLDVL